jgi:hypothetical protein
MDDNMLMMVKMRGEELMREARRGGRAAEARRAARTRQTVPAAARGLALRPVQWLALRPVQWLATAAGAVAGNGGRPDATDDNGTVIRT